MEFDPETHKVIIDTLSQAEARAFLAFLTSEIMRHEDDIKQAKERIAYVRSEFRL